MSRDNRIRNGGDVANALLADRIDHRKASLALYALQTAANNARSSNFDIDEDDSLMLSR